jgi:DNA-binding transcriptional ArsR family regulator
MAKLLPFRGEPTVDTGEPELLEIKDEAAGDVLNALTSETAREILSQLYQEPMTASDLADAVDTTLQNTRYHLERLEDAEVIEPVDTWYSSRGNEMTVYSPAMGPLVLAAGTEDDKSALRRFLGRLVGATVILGIASILINRFARLFGSPAITPGGEGPREGPIPSNETTVSSPGDSQTLTPTKGKPPTESTPTSEQPLCGEPITDTEDLIVTPENPCISPTPAQNTTATAHNTSQISDPTPTPTQTTNPPSSAETVVDTNASQLTTMGDVGLDSMFVLQPGTYFFAGGFIVLILLMIWWYRGRYPPYHT